jgi:WhiB family redox-sensing transcriptional regulator
MADMRRLPDPITQAWDWQLRGSCRGMDSEFFFHPDGERGPARVRRDIKAKAICHGCPVLAQCRRHALTVREPYGVWGGLTESERNNILTTAGGQPAVVAELPFVLLTVQGPRPHQLADVAPREGRIMTR